MATDTTVDTTVRQEHAAGALTGLQPARGGRLAGFGNLLGKELGEWFGTRRWLVQALVWLALVDGMVAFILFAVPAFAAQAAEPVGRDELLAQGLALLFLLLGTAGPVGVVILAQDELIGERQAGTAAWTLSKPVARAAFILAKLAANALGVALFVVGLPALGGYAAVSLAAGGPLAVAPFAAGLGPVALALLFYLALTLLLGVLFPQRGPVLGIALGLLFGGSLLANLVPQVGVVLPVGLANLGGALALGQPLPATAAATLAATAAWSALFIGAALWRFERQEL